jgi:hypothetical protein
MKQFPTPRCGERGFLLGLVCFLYIAPQGAHLVEGATFEQRGGGQRAGAEAAPLLFEESSDAVTWTGAWSTNPLASSSGGGARLAMDPGAKANFRFTGTGVTWIGYRDEWSGIATVLLDGAVQTTVDTYSTPARAQQPLFNIGGLEMGSHTLTIQVTGTKNPRSASAWVWVDAFSVTRDSSSDSFRENSVREIREERQGRDERPARGDRETVGREGNRRDTNGRDAGRDEQRGGSREFPRMSDSRGDQAPAGPQGRRGRGGDQPFEMEQDDQAITWSGAWSTNKLKVHRDGNARLAMEPSAKVTLNFRGTGVRWIGYQDEWSGFAEVRLDGRLRATVDTYSTPARAQAVLYSVDGLNDGEHTLTIQPAGRRRTGAQGSWVWIDAFSVLP